MNFIIIKMDDKLKYNYLIIGITCEALLDSLEEIAIELKNKNAQGNILFDTIMYSGNSEERFIESFFDGIKFDSDSFEYVLIERRNHIREKTCNILRDIPDLIDYSILSNTQKKLIQKGCFI